MQSTVTFRRKRGVTYFSVKNYNFASIKIVLSRHYCVGLDIESLSHTSSGFTDRIREISFAYPFSIVCLEHNTKDSN